MKKHKYLLDTNVLIAMFRGNQSVRNSIIRVGFDNCAVSEVSIAELFYGAAKSGRQSHFDDVKNVMRQFEIVPVFLSLERYGELKADLERKGMRIDEFDLLIAATAIFNQQTLVTANTKHFSRLPGLDIVNWEK